MNQQKTDELSQFVKQYMEIWNEPDVELRRKSIAELWTEDGVQFTNLHEYHGYQALEERVTAAYEQFVKTDGCIFKLASEVGAHHNAMKLTWDMVPAAGGEALATGIIFLVLAEDGRIRFDYQF
jgi:uncharacterized protein